jgi:hypothetical protein
MAEDMARASQAQRMRKSRPVRASFRPRAPQGLDVMVEDMARMGAANDIPGSEVPARA